MNLNQLKHAIIKHSENLSAELIQIRRHFHQYPELGRQEQQTTQFIKERLQSAGIPVTSHEPETGLWADLITRPNEDFFALRGDIDALPLEEKNSIPYASQHPGIMHACGHDAHATILLGSALVLNQLKNKLAGNVRFIFQPAEELTPGGSLDMIQRNVLHQVRTIITLHSDPGIAVGKVGIKYGALMASTDIFKIKLHGKGAHAASPDKSIDPILISAQLINALNHLVSRNIRPTTPAVLTVTRIFGGSAINIIPDKVEIWGTLRALDKSTRQFLQQRLRETVAGICQMHHAHFDLSIDEGAPPVTNEARITQLVETASSAILGQANVVQIEKPEMGAEDFAWYLEHIPGMIFRLGTKGRPGTDFELHHPNFDIDESALVTGVKAFCSSVIHYFASRN